MNLNACWWCGNGFWSVFVWFVIEGSLCASDLNRAILSAISWCAGVGWIVETLRKVWCSFGRQTLGRRVACAARPASDGQVSHAMMSRMGLRRSQAGAPDFVPASCLQNQARILRKFGAIPLWIWKWYGAFVDRVPINAYSSTGYFQRIMLRILPMAY